MVARTKVARARLTPQEYEQFETAAKAAGVKPSEYLRSLIVRMPGEIDALWAAFNDLSNRVRSLEACREES